ncbi:MAG: bifunctional phosphoribosyl-AMP cyclohydrolase/phosphoribosyl-ATP diphosphatase HisIE [Clostridiales bacterium]|nr:bifunctional phosphoribosyl-AMP cyclohydrolase/phosphoribosyl-ATP diphosphatase HisIE [Clostridiales bacterium]
MNYRQKDIIVTVFLKYGMLVKGFSDYTPAGSTEETIRSFNNSGIDKIFLFDLSDGEREHEQNLVTLKKITQFSELPVCAGGNINNINDIKKVLYAGCNKVILNSLKKQTEDLAAEGARRFGKDRMALSVFSADVFYKKRAAMQEYISEVVVLDPKLAGTMRDVTDMPYSVLIDDVSNEKIADILKRDENIKGISCSLFSANPSGVPELKTYLKEQGIGIDHLTSTRKWSSFKLNADGLIPVVVQDYQNNEVLMLAYMNEEAYEKTLETGRMTYYSRSRQELWVKGLTSGHFQYVKSLEIDCDSDTILAKVSQIGAACHTGNRSCFYTNLAEDEYQPRNMHGALTKTYENIRERKLYPKEGSYTSYLFENGIDTILKKIGKEATELIIASKNPGKEGSRYQMADLLYYAMVLMVEKEISIEDVLEEMMMR